MIMERILMFFLLTALFVSPLKAQRGLGSQWDGCRYLNLTEGQQQKIDDLRVQHQKKMLEYRNKMAENRAGYRSLMSSYPSNIEDIDKNIDEQTHLKNQMMKERAKHIQSIRGLLTEDQRVQFDMRKSRGWDGRPDTPGKGRMRTGRCLRAG